MRVLLFAQVVAVAFLLSGCPGAPASDPTGGGNCAPGENCSSTGSGTGGKGESTSSSGSAGAGNGGSSNGGAGGSNVGGAGNGSGGAGNAAGSGSGGNGVGGSGGDPKLCEPLELDILASQENAQKCDTEFPPATQCKDIIDGLCCPIAVNDINSPEVQAYLEALKAYQQNGCSPMCPPDPCPPDSKGSCVSSPGSSGTCIP